MKGKWFICWLMCVVFLSGCGKRELLEEKLDAEQIDKIVVTMAMGNPADGADCKIITDAAEIAEMVELFNQATVEGKIASGEEWEAGSSSYAFFHGEEQVLKLNCNANDAERIWINDGFYEIAYPQDKRSPYGLYSFSDAELVTVDSEGRIIKCPES